MSYLFRHATCNEYFEGWTLADTCKAVKKAGYAGIEIAPFTLAEDPASVTPAQRAEARDIIQSEGLEFVGLHWLMVSPKGLHVTTPDAALRARSWLHIRTLIDLCGDLKQHDADPAVLVFGSPAQRTATGGLSPAEATRNYVDGLASVAGQAAQRGVTILVEALPKGQCDVVLTLEEAVAIVREIDSPGVRTMFDTHNAVDEVEPHATLVDRYFDFIRHVHVNEMDGGYCGTGDYDFKPVLATLSRRKYAGWVSLEAFDFKPGAEKIASESLRYLERQIAELNL
ncbi:MAG: sugar phosphate isomerase/epimerase [Bryobacterales bacterium]|nr:sugar phosphate isomerase/epimerase [Bryobacterales bacterium]